MGKGSFNHYTALTCLIPVLIFCKMEEHKTIYGALMASNTTTINPNSSKFAKIFSVGIIILVAFYIFNPFVIVGPGERGVVMTFGQVSDDILGEGLHFRIPIMQKIKILDTKIQKSEGDGDAASKDMQQVSTRVAINYHLDPSKVAHTFQQIGNLDAVAERIILPAVHEAVKAATAKYTAEELIAKRQEVRDQIRKILDDRMKRSGVIVDEFSIINFKFSTEFENAIESKTTAEQLKLKAERDLERIRIEAEQKIATAKAEAEALLLQKANVSQELIELRKVEAQLKAIEKWDGRLPQVTGGSTPMIQLKTE